MTFYTLKKVIETPQSFDFRGLYLLIFTILDAKTKKVKKNLLIHIKITTNLSLLTQKTYFPKQITIYSKINNDVFQKQKKQLEWWYCFCSFTNLFRFF